MSVRAESSTMQEPSGNNDVVGVGEEDEAAFRRLIRDDSDDGVVDLSGTSDMDDDEDDDESALGDTPPTRRRVLCEHDDDRLSKRRTTTPTPMSTTTTTTTTTTTARVTPTTGATVGSPLGLLASQLIEQQQELRRVEQASLSLLSLSSTPPQSPSQSPTLGRRASGCMVGLRVSCGGLSAGGSVRKGVEVLVETMGGRLVGDEDQQQLGSGVLCVCDSSSSVLYDAAMALGARIVHPSWVVACWESKTLIDPADHRLPALVGCVVAVTGLSAHERLHVHRLVVRNGGVYSPDLSRTVTHLVASTAASYKYSFARTWGIPVVRLDWLLESLASGGLVDVRRYEFTAPAGQLPSVANAVADTAAVVAATTGSSRDTTTVDESMASGDGATRTPAHRYVVRAEKQQQQQQQQQQGQQRPRRLSSLARQREERERVRLSFETKDGAGVKRIMPYSHVPRQVGRVCLKSRSAKRSIAEGRDLDAKYDHQLLSRRPSLLASQSALSESDLLASLLASRHSNDKLNSPALSLSPSLSATVSNTGSTAGATSTNEEKDTIGKCVLSPIAAVTLLAQALPGRHPLLVDLCVQVCAENLQTVVPLISRLDLSKRALILKRAGL